jgi:hypothetical protein
MIYVKFWYFLKSFDNFKILNAIKNLMMQKCLPCVLLCGARQNKCLSCVILQAHAKAHLQPAQIQPTVVSRRSRDLTVDIR